MSVQGVGASGSKPELKTFFQVGLIFGRLLDLLTEISTL